MYKFKYSLTELDLMIPFERDVYVMLLHQQIEKENEELQQKSQ